MSEVGEVGEANRANAQARNASLLARWGRPLVAFWAGAFGVSTALPVIAAIYPAEQLPAWIGVFDVALAVVVVLAAVLLDTLARGQIDDHAIHVSYRVYRIAAALPLALLVVFFVVGEQIRWNVLLPGLAWRAWLLLYLLPAGIVAWGTNRAARHQRSSPDSPDDMDRVS
jgi:hypothetical protein